MTLTGIIPSNELHHTTDYDITHQELIMLLFGALYFILINPLIEEWYWRVLVYEMFGYKYKKLESSKWLCSIAYASYHYFTF
jgi:membrane protease YdiL (CAAX protease family)